MSETPRIGLPEMVEASVGKFLVYNEAARILDALVNLTAITVGENNPPLDHEDGDVHIAGPSAAGDWTGYGNNIAYVLTTGWMFIAPQEGWRVHNIADGADYKYDGTEWKQVFGLTHVFAVAEAGKPGAGAVVHKSIVPYDVEFGLDFTASQAHAEVDTTDSDGAVFSVMCDGYSVGTITFLESSILMQTESGMLRCEAGTMLEIIAPDPQDTELEGVYIALIANVV